MCSRVEFAGLAAERTQTARFPLARGKRATPRRPGSEAAPLDGRSIGTNSQEQERHANGVLLDRAALILGRAGSRRNWIVEAI
jgi:hypothetical protein